MKAEVKVNLFLGIRNVNDRSWFQNGSLGEIHSVLASRKSCSLHGNSFRLLHVAPITNNDAGQSSERVLCQYQYM